MQGAIRNIDSLKAWFFAVGKPFFTLSYAGQATQVIMRNVVVEDMEDAWKVLQQQVLAQAEYGRATLHLIVYTKEKSANNPDGRTNIDILPSGAQMAAPAGIGSLPGDYVTADKLAGILQEKENLWKLQRENEDLRAQVDNPGDWTTKLMEGLERIGATPLGQLFALKLMGAPMPANLSALTQQPAVSGAPAPSDQDGQTEDDFDENIEKTTEILGVTDTELAVKMRRFAETQPELARQIFQSV